MKKSLFKIRKALHKISGLQQLEQSINQKLITQNLMLGKLLSNQVKHLSDIKSLQEAEFSVFSQFGDDGLIQYLINTIEITTKTFIEFGVEDYEESNTRFLLMNNNWSGLVMDGSKEDIDYIRNDEVYWKYDLKALHVFVTRENIDQTLTSQGFSGEVGLLHIDIDGNDYWIWKEIRSIQPIIVIVEYNSVFGVNRPITVPYKADFYRTNEHYSNLYWGSSLLALCELAKSKGYSFVGCNSNGNNSYFVRNDKIGKIRTLTAQEGFVASKYRESRDEKGNLTFVMGTMRLEIIKGMKVYNVVTDQTEPL